MTTERQQRSAATTVLAVGVAVEAFVIVVVAVWAGVFAATGRADAPGTAAGLALFAMGLASGLAWAARAAVVRGSGLGRAVVITWQLVQGGSAGTVIASGAAGPALAIAWFAILLAVALALAALTMALNGGAQSSDQAT